MVLIGPSILTADLLHLGDALTEAENAGIDYVHVDVMDGHYVPNITFGPVMVSTVRRGTQLPVDVHLMIDAPERFIDEFAQAGSDAITVHLEAVTHVHAVLSQIRGHGIRAGIAINPTTSLTLLDDVLPFCDQVLIMSVNPGFGGQSFIPTALGRIERLRDAIASRDLRCDIQVDGGIKASNIGKVVSAGATMIVAGSAVFSDDVSVADAVQALRQGVEG
ncbi:MAG: ribulose-phosphate 3-epimerase [Thermomicrobiales bacterium]|nr:ribulose-phosphate 3-epimerase [Thermomicrobiales bacterium]